MTWAAKTQPAQSSDVTAIADALYGTVGVATYPTPGIAAANGVSLAEVLRYIQNLAEGDSISHARYIATTANMALSAWNTAATHTVFTVTGTVRMRMWITCTATLVDSVADIAVIKFGYVGATAAFIAATDAAGKNGQTITTGQLWYNTAPTAAPVAATSAILDYVVPGGLDVGYEITGEALEGGSLVFHCIWWPLDATGAVAIGGGGALA